MSENFRGGVWLTLYILETVNARSNDHARGRCTHLTYYCPSLLNLNDFVFFSLYRFMLTSPLTYIPRHTDGSFVVKRSLMFNSIQILFTVRGGGASGSHAGPPPDTITFRLLATARSRSSQAATCWVGGRHGRTRKWQIVTPGWLPMVSSSHQRPSGRSLDRPITVQAR